MNTLLLELHQRPFHSFLQALILIAACSMGASHAVAQGGPPMLTDDPGTPGDGKWENNIAVTVDTTPEGQVTQTPNIDLNYGYGERVQLNFQVGLVSQQVPDQERDSGLTQAVIGAKVRFVDGKSEKEGVSLSSYPKIGFRGPASSASRDLTPSDPQWQLPVEVRLGLGDIAITSELGRLFSKSAPFGWSYGVDAGYSVEEHVQLMLELHGETDTTPRRTTWLVNAGSRFEVSERIDIIMSLGRVIKSEGPAPEGLGYLGVTVHM